MKKIQRNTLILSILFILSGCNLTDVRQYGNDCPDWKYIQNQNTEICTSETLEFCLEDFQAAHNAGKCPISYKYCSLNKAK